MPAWYQESVEAVFKKVNSQISGLTVVEAQRRLKVNGPNSLPKERRLSGLGIMINQFRSAMVLILVGASTISFALGDLIDGWVIAAAVIINVVVGWAQEAKAERALDRLRQAVSFASIVRRDGKDHQVDAADIVVGDIVILQSGDRIPADARLIVVQSLSVNESALTGEPYPVEKSTGALEHERGVADRTNLVFLGTSVTGGDGEAVVVATGKQTELGRIAELVKATREEATPLQSQLQRLGRTLSYIILSISLAIFGVGILLERDAVEMFTTAVAVAVAAVPEGMIIGITVILTIGMQRMLKKKALTRKLVAAETLGSTTVICTDKTGTLTEGQMHVAGVIAASGEYDPDQPPHDHEFGEEVVDVLTIGMLCNDAFVENEDAPLKDWKVIGNPTERALLVAGNRLGFLKTAEEKKFPRLDSVPFSSERKYMMTLHRAAGTKHHRLLAKGAPERILALSNRVKEHGTVKHLTEARRQKLLKRFDQLSGTGLRLLAFAYRDVPSKVRSFADIDEANAALIFTGFVFIKDPLRPAVTETIKQVRQAGVKVAMITGDHRHTAAAIAAELGLPHENGHLIDGDELRRMSDHELSQRAQAVAVYARVSPEDKLRIVDALQARDEVVAMTGDGVNDAPALRSADIGIALGSGTAVAKETASMVLLDDNFNTIVSAVREGRVIFDNIRKLIAYLLADSFTQVIVIGASLLIGMWVRDFPLPLLAAQILWINLITDGFPHIALTVEPEEPESMRQPPRPKKESIVSRQIRALVISVSTIMAVMTLALFWYYWHTTGDEALARSVAFAALGVNTLLYAFSIKSLRHPIISRLTFNNPWLIVAVLLGLGLHLLALYLPALQRVFQITTLEPQHWLPIILAGLVVVSLVEVVKTRFIPRHAHHDVATKP